MISNSALNQDTDAWYLIHCRSRKEHYVETMVKTMFGFSVYCPTYQTYAYGKRLYEPLFPGYVFVQMNLRVFPLSRINTCPGVLRIVAFDGDPFPVPSQVLNEIAARAEYMAQLHYHPFQPGDHVRLKHESSLQGLEMIFMGPMTPERRVDVLLRFLGRLKKVRVDISELEKTSSSALSQEITSSYISSQRRLTRGKGRRIK